MRQQKWFVGLVAALVVALGLVSRAAEKPPASYQKAMTDLDTFTKGIDKVIAASDWDGIVTMATSARDAFLVAEKYWDGKDQAAKDIALTGAKQAQDLVAVAGQKSQEGAAFSAGEIRAVCEQCHAGHRERQPDGSFMIK